jgi:hypothetical protein
MNTSITRTRPGARSSLAAVALLAVTHAWAGDFSYQATGGLGYTDNPRRVSASDTLENSQETIATAGARFSFDQDSKRLQADVVGDIAYHEYLDNTFDSRLIGNVFADASFALVPERLLWSATEQFGQVLGDPFLPATPDNVEDINYFTTGPDFYVGLGSQMRLSVGGRYSLTTYERSPLDMTSTAGRVALIRVISDRKLISLNARVERVEYDDQTLDEDFDQMEAYIRYEANGARTNLSVDAGFSKLDRAAIVVDEDGPLLRFDASRQISNSSTLTLSGGRQFSTAAGAFISEQGIANTGLGTTPGRQTAEPFTYDRAILGWRFNQNRTGITVDASWSQRLYEGTPEFDLVLSTLAARYVREMSPRAALEFAASFTTADYKPPSPDYDEFGAGVTFSFHLSRDVSINAKYDFSKRDSDNLAGSYDENRIWLTLAYGHGEPRATRREPTFGIDTVSGQGN